MVINCQSRVRVAPGRLEKFLGRVQRVLRIPPTAATVCLVSDAQIAKWNRAYRGKSKLTDVLSFPAMVSRNKKAVRKSVPFKSGPEHSCHSESPRFWRGEESALKCFAGRSAAKPIRKGTHCGNSLKNGGVAPRGSEFCKGTALAVPKHRRGSGVLTPEANHYLGDIAIAPAVALRNARRAGHSLDSELRVLILHGVLHLLGYDHETDHGEMERLELRLRRRLEIG